MPRCRIGSIENTHYPSLGGGIRGSLRHLTLDRLGQPLLIKLKGTVEAFYK